MRAGFRDEDLGFGVGGLGFGVWGFGFGVWGLGSAYRCRYSIVSHFVTVSRTSVETLEVVVISESSDTIGLRRAEPHYACTGRYGMAARRFDFIKRFLDEGQVRLT